MKIQEKIGWYTTFQMKRSKRQRVMILSLGLCGTPVALPRAAAALRAVSLDLQEISQIVS